MIWIAAMSLLAAGGIAFWMSHDGYGFKPMKRWSRRKVNRLFAEAEFDRRPEAMDAIARAWGSRMDSQEWMRFKRFMLERFACKGDVRAIDALQADQGQRMGWEQGVIDRRKVSAGEGIDPPDEWGVREGGSGRHGAKRDAEAPAQEGRQRRRNGMDNRRS